MDQGLASKQITAKSFIRQHLFGIKIAKLFAEDMRVMWHGFFAFHIVLTQN